MPPWTPYQSCLAASDWLKRPPFAVVGDARIDAELEAPFTRQRVGQIDLDRRPAVAVRRDDVAVDENFAFVEYAFERQENPFARPVGRNFDMAAIAAQSLRVTQFGKLTLPDAR